MGGFLAAWAPAGLGSRPRVEGLWTDLKGLGPVSVNRCPASVVLPPTFPLGLHPFLRLLEQGQEVVTAAPSGLGLPTQSDWGDRGGADSPDLSSALSQLITGLVMSPSF